MAWIRDVALLVVVFTVFMAGRNMGRQEVEGRWNAEKLRTAEQIASQERDYANQLQTTRDQALEDSRELDRIRALPHPRLLCYARPAVPTVPTTAGGEPADVGPLSPDVGFDPAPALYTDIADAADSAVADCRAALATWPR